MKEIIEWDVARRCYILFMGRFKRVWAFKHLVEKVESIIKNSKACTRCKCNFSVDAINRNTFFWYIIIDGENKQDIEACDLQIFGVIFKELESLGLRHRVSHFSYPLSDLKDICLNTEG